MKLAGAHAFLSTLFSETTGKITVVTLPSSASQHFNSVEDAELHAEQQFDHSDVYVAIATRKEGVEKVGTHEELMQLPALWLDIDLPGEGHKKKLNFAPDVQSALAVLNGVLPEPTMVVHSGGGLHLYFLLERPLDVSTPQGVALGKQALKKLDSLARAEFAKHGWEFDDTTKVPGILRIPGTLNHKNKQRKPVILLDLSPSRTSFELLFENTQDVSSASRPRSESTSTSKDVLEGASTGDEKAARARALASLSKTPLGTAGLRSSLASFYDKHHASTDPDKQTTCIFVGRLLAGEAIERAGNRDNALTKATGVVGMMAPWDDAKTLANDLFGPSLDAAAQAMPSDPGPDRSRVAYMIGRAQTRKQNSLIEDALFLEDFGRLARLQADPDAKGSGKYSDEELTDFASRHHLSTREFQKRWILVHEGAHYFFAGGKYRSPVTKDLDLHITQHLAPAPLVFKKKNSNGQWVRRPAHDMIVDYGTAVGKVKADLTSMESRYDEREDTFYEAVCPLRKLKPTRNPYVETWLASMGGSRVDKLLDWVAVVTLLEKQCAALFISGPKGIGKNVLARGLAQCWNKEGSTTDIEEVLANFNGDLARCPLIFADEKIEARNKRKIAGELRKIIGSNVRPLTRKFLPNADLIGAVRMILAANNDRMLEVDHEDLGGDDLDAVASRFVHVPVTWEASKLLEDYKRRGIVEEWFRTDAIAKHALWLKETRTIVEGSRFLVEGDPQGMTQKLSRQSKIAQLVLQWLVKYLTNPIPQPAQLGLIEAGEGKLVVCTSVFDDWWDKYVKSDDVPMAARIGRVLSNLSTGGTEIHRVGNCRAHSIKIEHLIEWSEEHNVGDADRILTRVNGPRENLKDPNNVISLDVVRAEKRKGDLEDVV